MKTTSMIRVQCAAKRKSEKLLLRNFKYFIKTNEDKMAFSTFASGTNEVSLLENHLKEDKPLHELNFKIFSINDFLYVRIRSKNFEQLFAAEFQFLALKMSESI